jgi:hypothetical protein
LVVSHIRRLRQAPLLIGPNPAELAQPVQSLRRRIRQIVPFGIRELRHLPNQQIGPGPIWRKDHLLGKQWLDGFGALNLVAFGLFQIDDEGIAGIEPP